MDIEKIEKYVRDAFVNTIQDIQKYIWTIFMKE